MFKKIGVVVGLQVTGRASSATAVRKYQILCPRPRSALRPASMRVPCACVVTAGSHAGGSAAGVTVALGGAAERGGGGGLVGGSGTRCEDAWAGGAWVKGCGGEGRDSGERSERSLGFEGGSAEGAGRLRGTAPPGE